MSYITEPKFETKESVLIGGDPTYIPDANGASPILVFYVNVHNFPKESSTFSTYYAFQHSLYHNSKLRITVCVYTRQNAIWRNAL